MRVHTGKLRLGVGGSRPKELTLCLPIRRRDHHGALARDTLLVANCHLYVGLVRPRKREFGEVLGFDWFRTQVQESNGAGAMQPSILAQGVTTESRRGWRGIWSRRRALTRKPVDDADDPGRPANARRRRRMRAQRKWEGRWTSADGEQLWPWCTHRDVLLLFCFFPCHFLTFLVSTHFQMLSVL